MRVGARAGVRGMAGYRIRQSREAVGNSLLWGAGRVAGWLYRIYFMALPENEEDVRRSRRFYVMGDSAAQTIAQLAGGTFLVSLLLSAGFSDAQAGVVTSTASLAAVFQLFTMQRINRLKKRKLFVCFCVLQKLLLAVLFFLPLMNVEGMDGRFLQALLLCGYFLVQVWSQIGTPATQDWIASLVPLGERGSYFSKKDAVAVFVTVTLMLVMGFVMDLCAGPRQLLGFLINGSLILFLALLNFGAFSLMKEPRLGETTPDGREIHLRRARKRPGDMPDEKGAPPFSLSAHERKTASCGSLMAEVREAFRDRDFRMAFFTNLLWLTAFYTASPFNTSYQLGELSLSFTFLMVVGFLGNLARIAVTPAVGRLGDRYGMACVYKYSLIGILLNFASFTLAVPANAPIMTVLGTVFSALGWSFAGIGLFGIQLELIREEKRTLQLSILSALGGIYGFLVSFLTGRLLSFLQEAQSSVMGVKLYAQQITNTLGVFFLAVLIAYLKFFVQKREREVMGKG